MTTIDHARETVRATTGIDPLSAGECRALVGELQDGRPLDPLLAARTMATISALLLALDSVDAGSGPPNGPFTVIKFGG